MSDTFDRNWHGPRDLKPRCYTDQHMKDTWMSVCVLDEYATPAFAPDDAVIDIGAHMGSWSYRAWLNGSRRIYAFECDETRWPAFRENTAGCDGITLFEAPADVEAVDALIESCGTVRFMKMDCEGCEWPILFGSKQLARVQEISGEYHDASHMAGADTKRLKAHLLAAGFTVEIEPGAAALGHFHAWRGR